MYLLLIWGRRNDFDMGSIHFEGPWALKIETFLGPEMATIKASAYRLTQLFKANTQNPVGHDSAV
jgi:hypothetical protein